MNAAKTIIVTGLIAGSLDILTAFTDYYIQTGKEPEGVLRFIASGLLGKDAFTERMIVAWFGLLFHFIIAYIFTLVFFLLYPKIKLLRINIFLTAIIIGMVIWIIMNLIVVPLSNTPEIPFNWIKSLKAMLILMCMFGLPMAILFKKHYN
ncbi:MAG: hypothetical protein JST21_11360 [Bacteroidetes bacterium]|nr:hypothetical protein [Bacteroidota bacterium]